MQFLIYLTVDQHPLKEMTSLAPSLGGDKKRHLTAMKLLYGDEGGVKIHSLETTLNMKYDTCAANRAGKSALWPHLPINIKF